MIMVDIEMPESCASCPMCHPKSRSAPWVQCCYALLEDVDIKHFDTKKLDNCPIADKPVEELVLDESVKEELAGAVYNALKDFMYENLKVTVKRE